MLVLCFIGVLALLGVTSYVGYETIKHNQRSFAISRALISYLCDQDETGYTDFDKSLNNLAEVISAKQANTIVATLRGQIGGAVRSAESALEQEARETMPEAAIMAALPKKIQKNPLAQMGLASIVQKLMQGQASARPEASGGNGKVKFNL